MFVFALEKNIHGTFNAVAPQYNSFLDIIREIEKSTQRKTLYLPVPKFLLKLMLGEFAETLYASQKVSADKIVNVGYQFKYDTLQKAIASLT
jgi:NAD dependent epimerase/dehydratase family enzyme